ncbi:glycosyltransferase family 4 protein [Paenibacillus frigoriresistens]|uniref:glycosyltransferase family 4 protein n=1 Tax=Paenibacillus alginolyticus TaxID=59839 RepID=UPI0015641413|nr:glycosyltransferase family 4 protein [Paenibacillus frigoriresistens]NRF95754.1 glycosyltransferase family 4 protein [Paenibacillus frigoriresistens]
MKKIGIFTGYYLPHLGGVERYTEKLAEELRRLGFQIVIVTSNHENISCYESDNHKIYRLPIHGIFKNRYPIIKKNDEFKKKMNELNEENIDYFICNTRFHLTSLLCAQIANKKNKPVLLIEHGSNHFTVNNKVLDFFGEIYEHLLTNKLKKYIKNFYGVSQRCNQWLKHFGINAISTLYNSVDENDYENFRNKSYKMKFMNKTVLLFAGRVIREKGIVLLLDVFLELSKKHRDIVLVVAGDGPILSELKVRYASANIYFEGKLNYEEIMPLFNISDIFCHPSMFPEGLPTSILEAGLMKCAIVATDRGGTVEVINDNQYGIIVKEDYKDLFNKLDELILDKSRIESLKNNIHNRIKEEFVWSKTAKKILEQIKEIENGKKY